MLNRLKKQTEGFTIIEVMIVLAIAGLIILIVLLAIPALQRNSRNTTLRNDVATTLGAVSEFQTVNNGKMPTSIAGSNASLVISSSVAGTSPITVAIAGGTTVSSVTTAPAAGTPTNGTIVVSIGFKCDGTASTRAVAALYAVETSGTSVRTCQDG